MTQANADRSRPLRRIACRGSGPRPLLLELPSCEIVPSHSIILQTTSKCVTNAREPRASLHHTREVSQTHLRRACTSKEQYMAQRYWLRNLHQSRVEKRSVNSLGLVGSWTCVLDPLRAVRECHHCMPPPGEGMTPPYGHTEGNRITREVENISASGVFQKVFRNI